MFNFFQVFLYPKLFLVPFIETLKSHPLLCSEQIFFSAFKKKRYPRKTFQSMINYLPWFYKNTFFLNKAAFWMKIIQKIWSDFMFSLQLNTHWIEHSLDCFATPAGVSKRSQSTLVRFNPNKSSFVSISF